MTVDPRVPDKEAFRIGEVARLAGVTPSVLRFWETEFASLRPTKTRSGQRLYRRVDVEKVMRIRDLLYDQGFTIAGARKALREGADAAEDSLGPRQRAAVAAARKEAQDLLRLLGG
ncbi:MAG: MerR family transcriptional regulator [Myxococcales bacterium]|nr:MerR family transcriptional regulator [Myxococcales bacterium]